MAVNFFIRQFNRFGGGGKAGFLAEVGFQTRLPSART